jgi:hypothetical protein
VHDFENFQTLKPNPRQETLLATLFEQVEAWSGALRTVRVGALAVAA